MQSSSKKPKNQVFNFTNWRTQLKTCTSLRDKPLWKAETGKLDSGLKKKKWCYEYFWEATWIWHVERYPNKQQNKVSKIHAFTVSGLSHWLWVIIVWPGILVKLAFSRTACFFILVGHISQAVAVTYNKRGNN